MGGHGRGGRPVDIEAQKKQNAEAPRVRNLGRRVMALFRPYRVPIAITLVLVGISAAIAVVPPLIVQRIFDDALFPIEGSVHLKLLVWLVVAMVGLYVLSSALSITVTWLSSRVGSRMTGDLRIQLFEHLQAMELSFFSKTKTGVIQSRIQNDVSAVSGVLTNTTISILGNAVTVIASAIAMIIIDWRLTLIALAVMPILIFVQRRVGQVRARIAAQTQESLSELNSITQETLSVSGILLSKSFHRQRVDSARFADENQNQITLQVRRAMSGQGFFAIVGVLMSSVPAVVYLASGFLLNGGVDTITAGAIVAFTTVQARLLQPLMGLMRVALDVQTSSAIFARIFEYLDLVPAITDAPDARAVDPDAPDYGRIEFVDVAFRYPDASEDRPTLRGVSFVAERGQHVAFVGASGSGKTTILYLAARFYDATQGQVLFGGRDVRELTQESLIASLGMVAQETYLFHSTVRENLRYACPEATDDEIEAACRAANIHHVIESFEQGYDTVVGERGYRLSGGEKQRIAIARVLLKNPAVLLLDEATSALDTVSEHVVREALEAASAGRTTLTIAHRLSTVVHADMIHVVDKGRIIESGTHSELLARGGAYAELAQRQLAGALIPVSPSALAEGEAADETAASAAMIMDTDEGGIAPGEDPPEIPSA